MKHFIKQLSIFLLITIIVITGLQLLLSFKVKGKIINGHDNLDQTANVNADLLFLGSSRCWTQFDPTFFDSTFHLKSLNIGIDGHSELSMMIVRLATYLSTNRSPKFVIVNFDPLVSAGSLTDNKNFVQKNRFARFAFMPTEKNLPFLNYYKFDNKEKFIPLYAIFKYSIINDYIFSNNISSYAKYGYERHDEKWDTVAHPVNNTLKQYYSNDAQIKSISSMLDTLKKMCAANNAKLLCVQTPLYKSLWDDAAFARTRQICKDLNIPFIDANVATIGDNMENFYNTDHMNTNGVRKLNAFLANDFLLASFLK